MWKKLMIVFGVLFLGLVSLHADDKADVKNTIAKIYECGEKLDFDGMLQLYTQDAKETNKDGKTVTFVEMKGLTSLLKQLQSIMDGKHIEDFISLGLQQKNGGKALTAEEQKKVREIAQTADAQKQYQAACLQMKTMMPKTQTAIRNEALTLRFISIDVSGNTAVAVTDSVRTDITNNTTAQVTTTRKLRKENGAWKIYESVEKAKK